MRDVKRLLILGIILVLLLASVGAVSALNLVTNGGFEKPGVTSLTKWDIFPSGTPTLDWTVVWTPADYALSPYHGITIPTIANLELQKAFTDDGIIPQEGNQYAELDTDWNGHVGNLAGEPANVKISEDLSTIAGGGYHISYWQRCRAIEPTCNLQFDWGAFSASTGGVGGVSGVWTHHEFDLTAPGTLTTISFTDTGVPNTYGTLIDNVSVELTRAPPSIPEFPSVALPVALIVGLLGAVLFIKNTKEN
jgi:hypothetical protein